VSECAERLARTLRGRPLVAHCAGALDLSVFEPLKERGLPVGSLHPLQAVPSAATPLRAHASVEASTPSATRLLERLARDAGLIPMRLRAADRALYHCAAAMASNGLVALADRAAALLVQSGVPRKHALQATIDLMRSALEGVSREGLPGALTGPIARGEAAIVRAHLAALARSAKTDLPLYRALGEAQVALSRASKKDLKAIRAALRQSDTGRAAPRTRAPRAGRAPRRLPRGRASRAPRSS